MKKSMETLEKYDPEYLVTLDEIYHSHWFIKKQRRINLLKKAIQYFWPDGHPSSFIHVTGTNGKGSVIYYLEQGFQKYDSVGAWIGPHLFDYAERFHINGQTVSHSDIIKIYKEKLIPYQEILDQKTGGDSLSFAEIGILISMHLFEQYKVKWAMMEVGAGGRYTPLMALDVVACILTNVGNDHTKTLGIKIWQRVLEKAGIARSNTPFFSAAEGKTGKYVEKAALARGAKVLKLSRKDFNAVRSQLPETPKFKINNLTLAVKVIRHYYPEFKFNPSIISKDLKGRFWMIEPNIIADVSHNTDKVESFIEYLKLKYKNKKFKFILGLTRKRKAHNVFKSLKGISRSIVITSASYAGRDPQKIYEELKNIGLKHLRIEPDPAKAYLTEKKNLKKDQILILTGSAYMIEQALNPNPFIKHINLTYGRRYQ